MPQKLTKDSKIAWESDNPFDELLLLIEEERSYKEITQQLIHEQQWLHGPNSCKDTNRTGISHLEQNGYTGWLKDAEEEDFVRMVGVLQLILETFSALEESLDEND